MVCVVDDHREVGGPDRPLRESGIPGLRVRRGRRASARGHGALRRAARPRRSSRRRTSPSTEACAEAIVERYEGRDAYLSQADAFALLAALRHPGAEDRGASASVGRPGGGGRTGGVPVRAQGRLGRGRPQVRRRAAWRWGSATRRRSRAAFDSHAQTVSPAERAPVVVQEQKPPGREVIIGQAACPGLGSLVMFGLGGIFVEVMKDVVVRAGAALAAGEAREMIARDQGLPDARGGPRREPGRPRRPSRTCCAASRAWRRTSRPSRRWTSTRSSPTRRDRRRRRRRAHPGRVDGPRRFRSDSLCGGCDPMIHSVAAAVVLFYVIGLFIVTWWAQRLPQGGGGMIGYLLAGRQVPTSVTAAMLTGLAVGGASTIGVAEQAYTKRHLSRLVQRRVGRRRRRDGPRLREALPPPRVDDHQRTVRAPLRRLGPRARRHRPAGAPGCRHLAAVRRRGARSCRR